MIFHIHERRVHLLLTALTAAAVVAILYLLLTEPEVLPPPGSLEELSLTRELRNCCRLLQEDNRAQLPLLAVPRTREELAWVCARVDVLLPWPLESACGREVTYAPADGLEQNLLRYAVMFGFRRLLHVDAQVEESMLSALHPAFPGLTLTPPVDGGPWQPIAFKTALREVRCLPGERHGDSEPRRYQITGPPDGSAIHLFHPFEAELRHELRFDSDLWWRAESTLRSARGRRSSATYIGLLLPTPDDKRRHLADNYLSNCLNHYRSLFSDALFIVLAEDARAWAQLVVREDVVRVEADVASDPAVSLAVRAACNHSIVVGDEGFWGAYLAGGKVTVPKPEASEVAGFGWLLFHSQMLADSRWTVVKTM